MTLAGVTEVSGVVGLVLPFVVDFINLHVVNSTVRFVIALIASFIAAFAITYLGGNFDGTQILASLGVVFTLSQTVYKAYWGDSGLRISVAKTIAPDSDVADTKKK